MLFFANIIFIPFNQSGPFLLRLSSFRTLWKGWNLPSLVLISSLQNLTLTLFADIPDQSQE